MRMAIPVSGSAKPSTPISRPNPSPAPAHPIIGYMQNLRDENSPAGSLSSVLSSREWVPGTAPRERNISSASPGLPSRQSQGGFSGTDLDSKVYPPMAMAGQKRKFTEIRDGTTDNAREQQQLGVGGSRGDGAGTEELDVVDRGIISISLAAELFVRYTERMCRHLPGVVFPPGTSVTDVRRSKPTLFLSVMTAASSELPTIQRALTKELMQVIAEKTIMRGEKSLELVQAIQLRSHLVLAARALRGIKVLSASPRRRRHGHRHGPGQEEAEPGWL